MAPPLVEHQATTLTGLPPEIISQIATYTDIPTTLAIKHTCQSLCHAVSYVTLWKTLIDLSTSKKQLGREHLWTATLLSLRPDMVLEQWIQCAIASYVAEKLAHRCELPSNYSLWLPQLALLRHPYIRSMDWVGYYEDFEDPDTLFAQLLAILTSDIDDTLWLFDPLPFDPEPFEWTLFRNRYPSTNIYAILDRISSCHLYMDYLEEVGSDEDWLRWELPEPRHLCLMPVAVPAGLPKVPLPFSEVLLADWHMNHVAAMLEDNDLFEIRWRGQVAYPPCSDGPIYFKRRAHSEIASPTRWEERAANSASSELIDISISFPVIADGDLPQTMIGTLDISRSGSQGQIIAQGSFLRGGEAKRCHLKATFTALGVVGQTWWEPTERGDTIRSFWLWQDMFRP